MLIVALVLLLRNGENSRKILVWKKIIENVTVSTMQLQVALCNLIVSQVRLNKDNSFKPSLSCNLFFSNRLDVRMLITSRTKPKLHSVRTDRVDKVNLTFILYFRLKRFASEETKYIFDYILSYPFSMTSQQAISLLNLTLRRFNFRMDRHTFPLFS